MVHAKMLKADRADLIVTTQEETEIYIQQSGFSEKDFPRIEIPLDVLSHGGETLYSLQQTGPSRGD